MSPRKFVILSSLSLVLIALSAAELFRSEGFEPRPDADTRYPGGQRCLRLGRALNAP